MTVFFSKIDELSDGVVQFYTVRIGESECTEFENFDSQDFPDHTEERQILYNVIAQMFERGALPWYFKPEGPASALPRVPKVIMDANKDDFGLRLYCYRLSSEIVVLLNGGIKTVKAEAQKCPNVGRHCKFAISLSARLDKEIGNKNIDPEDPNCLKDLEIDI